ncbi:MAG TPA: glycosyl hydrolase family 39 [Edaphobacter sp.]|nr:glycosyl hydrolase family 39 [Edaphobacter sp.]
MPLKLTPSMPVHQEICHRSRSSVLLASLILCLFVVTAPFAANAQTKQPESETIEINPDGATTPFPHFWETMFGSGRAILSLRDGYRRDLQSVKRVTELRTVRFHGIFDDEVGLYDPDRKPVQFAQMRGKQQQATDDQAGIYNFSYIDQIYDGLLEQGVRPFIELSFMPRKLSSQPDASHPFWYRPNVNPPKDYSQWDAMITAFVQHLVDRYGLDEVSQWDFEVWNEPNLDFWKGTPAQASYFELYDHTALAIKKVNPRLRVGGPSTAQAAWTGDFLRHCKDKNIPVDFVTSHVYANDTAKDVFHTDETIPRDRMVCRSVRKVHDEIAASPFPKLPLIFSEYNASYANEPDVTDTIYMGPWLATTISQCDGMTEAMSYWTFSDVFEEQGVIRTPFYGGFGIVAEHGIPKPAFNAFAMLHQLGDQRIPLQSDSALATRRSDGSIAVALWNYAPPYGTGASYARPPSTPGPNRTFTLQIAGAASSEEATVLRLDETHGNVIRTYDQMGRPAFPSREQIVQLREAGRPAPPERMTVQDGRLQIQVPPQGLVVVLIHQGKAAR